MDEFYNKYLNENNDDQEVINMNMYQRTKMTVKDKNYNEEELKLNDIKW